MSKIIPVILCGGVGSRLWPLSRELYPKQFLKLVGDHSLLQETILRIDDITDFDQVITVCNEAQFFIAQEQLQAVSQSKLQFILEPMGKNTAPAIALAAMTAIQDTPDATLLVLPADHLIADRKALADAVTVAHQAAKEDFLVTFGIKPTEAKTGYGYIKQGKKDPSGCFDIAEFKEKPDQKTAEDFLAQGDFFWNSGMFVFKAQSYLNELKKHAAPIFDHVKQVFEQAKTTDQLTRLDAELFNQCPSDSIDYAVMEKTELAKMIPLDAKWTDLGCWTSVAEAGQKDAHNNVIHGQVMTQDTENCLINTESGLVATIGIKDLVIVNTKDAVLVADKNYSQQVKTLVAQLKSDNNDLTNAHTLVYRPWGFYESLVMMPNFQVKHIMVKPGAQLSLQMHHHRSEHWVVVKGTATVVNGEREFELPQNESTFIPKETKHRLSNHTDDELHIVEVQTGDYLGEDDIVRYEDIYQRS